MVAAEKPSEAYVTDFTDVIGGNGPWQKVIFWMVFFAGFPCAWHTLIMSFLAPNIDFWCAKPPEYSNLTDDEWKLYGIPSALQGYTEEERQCKMFKFVNTTHDMHHNDTSSIGMNTLIPCHKWQYDDSMYRSTLVSQWDLVCENAWTVSMTNSVFMFGALSSVVILGQVSDRIGRKPALMATVLVLTSAGVVCAFSTSYVMFAVARFFSALGSGGLFVTGFIILMEAVGRDHRSLYGLSMEFGWCFGYVLLPLVAWLIRDAFWIQVVAIMPCIALLLMWCLVPESPRWLLAQNRYKQAEEVLSKAAKKNGIDIPDIETTVQKLSARSAMEKPEEQQMGTILDLFRTPGLWQKTLNLIFNWMVISFVYYGLSFNTNDLAGDPFVNFAIAGAVEFPAYLISIFVIQSLGRRMPLMATMVSGGIACLLTVVLTGDLAWIRVPLAMFGKFCITAAFGIVYVYTAELFPTVVRNTGVGTCSMCGRGVSILAPFVKELGHATHPAVPLVCFGGLSVASGILILLLPETNRCRVPDTLQEAADFGRKKTSSRDDTCLVHHENGSSVTSFSNSRSPTETDVSDNPYQSRTLKQDGPESGDNGSSYVPTYTASA